MLRRFARRSPLLLIPNPLHTSTPTHLVNRFLLSCPFRYNPIVLVSNLRVYYKEVYRTSCSLRNILLNFLQYNVEVRTPPLEMVFMAGPHWEYILGVEGYCRRETRLEASRISGGKVMDGLR